MSDTDSVDSGQPAAAETTKNSEVAHGGRFRKGMKRPKGSGRKPGSPNKINRTIKQAWEAAFTELQSDPRTELVSWAKRNKSNLKAFYALCARALSRVEINTNTQINLHEPEQPVDIRELARSIGFVLTRAAQEESPALLPYVPETEGHPVLQFAPGAASSETRAAGERIREAQRKQELADQREGELQERIIEAECRQQSNPRPTSYRPPNRYRGG